jgi:hypothetical protein
MAIFCFTNSDYRLIQTIQGSKCVLDKSGAYRHTRVLTDICDSQLVSVSAGQEPREAGEAV